MEDELAGRDERLKTVQHELFQSHQRLRTVEDELVERDERLVQLRAELKSSQEDCGSKSDEVFTAWFSTVVMTNSRVILADQIRRGIVDFVVLGFTVACVLIDCRITGLVRPSVCLSVCPVRAGS